LFPGYVFSRFDISGYSSAVSTAGVIEAVRFGRQLAAIEDSEIENLQRVVGSGLSCFPWPRLEIGDLVNITDGPLAGLSGVVIELKKSPRLVLSVNLLQRSVLAELERDWIERAPVPRSALANFSSAHHNPTQRPA
jgi:transcription antitermination factor NusG